MIGSVSAVGLFDCVFYSSLFAYSIDAPLHYEQSKSLRLRSIGPARNAIWKMLEKRAKAAVSCDDII